MLKATHIVQVKFKQKFYFMISESKCEAVGFNKLYFAKTSKIVIIHVLYILKGKFPL